MQIAAFEPGQEMAIANFSLGMFCLFTFVLPLLLITRGGKTEANRDFIATINPWYQSDKKIELTPVVISEITPTNELQPKPEVISVDKVESISESEVKVSIKEKHSEELEDSSTHVLTINDEILAA